MASLAAVCCVFHQLATWCVEIQLGKLTVGGVTQIKTKTDIPKEHSFQNQIICCSIVFQRNKYVNLACILKICTKKIHIVPKTHFGTIELEAQNASSFGLQNISMLEEKR